MNPMSLIPTNYIILLLVAIAIAYLKSMFSK